MPKAPVSPGVQVTDGCEPCVLGIKIGPLEEQEVPLTIKSRLQSQYILYLSTVLHLSVLLL